MKKTKKDLDATLLYYVLYGGPLPSSLLDDLESLQFCTPQPRSISARCGVPSRKYIVIIHLTVVS